MTNINKNSIYKIERGIPLPSNRKGGKWANLCSQMNDGDSVVVANHNECINMRQAIIRSKKKSSAKQLPDGSYRVWKLPMEWTR